MLVSIFKREKYIKLFILNDSIYFPFKYYYHILVCAKCLKQTVHIQTVIEKNKYNEKKQDRKVTKVVKINK